MNWQDLHKAICTKLKEEISAIQTCEIYPAIRKELLAPAVFVELSGFEKGHDPGTEELALKARFEARIVIDSTIENAPVIVRTLAAEVARVVNKNTWNVENVSPGEFISAEIDGFRPELDAYLVWVVDWVHEIHIGKSVWSETGIKPHIIEIGNVHVGS
ncbi:putative phage related protein [Wolbachia endosymbiont of Culex quinquefasciatus JHB]|uniref:hypothetical protein n=1 Tax=unclassified Wolbachia TaxID=2640676 RepID=UPI0001761CC2|nr:MULTISPECIES: hypothetical protein [unclassified Wolbachia]EEB55300.1 putative phage related protein [Wolbachia endosymbiont of Culex quinquefasciatus JHB]EEB56100.1 putative phage related protein [Wolbachia endosymbiont of Culex quinquefasciatus JHB]CAQ54355.1 Putative phage related protein [Wolbachia endosymbiont of Culex quinquefasciatus Pel]CAQ54439.1 Putative phage related protein [Wolbachia endosymbiont of Culex quinquefasciatus Pel]CQD11181.1 Putative phage related protein [Wolbachia